MPDETDRPADAPLHTGLAVSVLTGGMRVWRSAISPLTGHNCRFYPSCSCYGIEAVRRYGALRGSGMALGRILRCNPWSAGGVDPVPVQKESGKNGASAEERLEIGRNFGMTDR